MTTQELLDLANAREWAISGAAQVIREARSLSLRDVARAVGVAPSTVMRWEAGEFQPTGKAAIRYARLLRELMRPPGPQTREPEVSPRFKRLAR